MRKIIGTLYFHVTLLNDDDSTVLAARATHHHRQNFIVSSSSFRLSMFHYFSHALTSFYWISLSANRSTSIRFAMNLRIEHIFLYSSISLYLQIISSYIDTFFSTRNGNMHLYSIGYYDYAKFNKTREISIKQM